MLAIALTVLAVIGGLLAADIKIAGQVEGGGDFYGLWAGTRAYLFDGRSPYSADVAAVAQRLAYGRPATAEDHPYRLVTPFFLLPIFFPLGLLNTPAIARAVWLCLSQAALVAMVWLSLSIVEWRLPRLLTLLIGCVSVFGFYAVSALLAGTLAVFLGLLYMATLWALRDERLELAGALIALSLFMWEVGAIFLILVMWRVFHYRQWRVLAGLAMTLVILLGASFLLDPAWVLPFLTSVVGQLRSGGGTSLASSLVSLSPQRGPLLARLVTILVLVVLVYEWWSARDDEFKRFVWLACLALALTPLLGMQTEVTNLVVLTPSMALICAASAQRGRLSGLLGLVILIAAFGVPWILVSPGPHMEGVTRDALLFLWYPAVTVVGLYWTRWWFLRPRRTWLDEIRAGRKDLGAKPPLP